jgi:ABC-type Zn uptake system ZnuABC Zn-binding protein ZnuA
MDSLFAIGMNLMFVNDVTKKIAKVTLFFEKITTGSKIYFHRTMRIHYVFCYICSSMPKWIFIIIFTLLFVGCKNDKFNDRNKQHRLSVLTSVRPLNFIVNEIVGDSADVATLLDAKDSPHTFDMLPSKARELMNADVVFYVANTLDGWVSRSAKERSISMLNLLHPDTLEAHHNDPHFWVSPYAVRSILSGVCDKLCQLDSANSTYYLANAERFAKRLDSLHSELVERLAPIKDKPIFTEHNSFGWFIDEFGLKYGGAIEEISGKESGTRYVAELVTLIKQSNVKYIYREPQINPKHIRLIAAESNVEVGILDPIGASSDIDTYFELIDWNAEQLLRLK